MGVRTLAWERRYGGKILATDIVVVVTSVFLAQYLRFGSGPETLRIPLTGNRELDISYSILSLILVSSWLVLLKSFDTRDPKIYGAGPVEYRRVIHATLATFATLTIIAFLFKSQVGRGYLLIALPLGIILLITCRFIWRKRLHWQRRRGRNVYRTIVMGEREKSRHVARYIMQSSYAGFQLVGAVTEKGTSKEIVHGLEVIASYDHLLDAIDTYSADTLIVTAADSITPEHLRRIGWELENRNIDLIVAASLTDVAGPRIHMRPVSNLPLIHVEYPQFTGRKYLAKRLFDITLSAILLIVLSPIFLAIAVLVRTSGAGPILFRQERVGLEGARFKMLKFRSMSADAEAQRSGLLDRSEGNGVLFKIKDDPRITPVGRILRRYSLDELPQILNVLRGDMSIVGPRPQLPEEVELYEKWVDRRLLVKPGITGLWQVSGRSNLSWNDSVRLDLYYAENWSMIGDLVILARTVKTVATAEGAY